MISAGVKSNIKQQEIKDLAAAFYKLLKQVPSKLQIQWAAPEKIAIRYKLVLLYSYNEEEN